MNKKTIIMLTAIICVVSIILVSIFGQVPNFQTNVLVKTISIEGYLDKNGNIIPCEKNNAGEDIIWLDKIEAGETSIVLKWKINPNNASNPDVYFSTGIDDDSIVVSDQGIVTFYTSTRTNCVVTIKAKDGSLVFARVIIMKRVSNDSPDGGVEL
ncbi:MAG: hypothetical protein IJ999_02905 [Clostridia bacterium]|nr:hypothetical protein [Clostridia bacterium]